ncbi:MAG: hypothetical protein ABGW78_04155 [Pirellulales bacterium]
MKLGMFWLGRVSEEIDLAIQFLTRVNGDVPFEQLTLFTDRPQSNSTLFERKTTQYPYDTINDLQDVYRHARDKNLDFALISFGNGIPVSLDRLAALLASESVQKSIWSFRICRIVGAGFRHSPRFPLVDDHFIVLNLKRAVETAFFDRKLVHASHFCEGGGRHAHLLSMIEYSINEGEFHNHYVPDASRNYFGRICLFNPMPFHLCESTGFLTLYSEFKPALLRLLRQNLAAQHHQPISWLNRMRYFRRSEFWYFSPLVNLKPIMAMLKLLFRTDNFQFQKKYVDKIK